MSKQIDNPSYYDLEEATALMRDFIPFLFGSNKVSRKNEEILMELSSTKLSPEGREEIASLSNDDGWLVINSKESFNLLEIIEYETKFILAFVL